MISCWTNLCRHARGEGLFSSRDPSDLFGNRFSHCEGSCQFLLLYWALNPAEGAGSDLVGVDPLLHRSDHSWSVSSEAATVS